MPADAPLACLQVGDREPAHGDGIPVADLLGEVGGLLHRQLHLWGQPLLRRVGVAGVVEGGP